MTSYVQVHTYPFELTPDDKLTDGKDGASFSITENTQFIWVDLHPDQKFVHDTEYIFISAAGAHVEKGQWWPELNGRRILYGECNPVAVLSPFKVERPSQ